MTTQDGPTMDINKNSVLLALRLTKPGNRRKVNSGLVEVDADKDSVHINKELLDSREFTDIVSHDSAIRQWIYARSLPAYGTLKEGVYRVPLSLVDEIDQKLLAFREKREDLIPISWRCTRKG